MITASVRVTSLTRLRVSCEHHDPVTEFHCPIEIGRVQPVVVAPGIRGESACDSDALLLAAGVLPRIAVTIVGGVEGDQFEKLVDPIGEADPIPAEYLRNDRDIRRDGELGEEPSGLDDVADAPSQFITVDLGHVFLTEHCATISRLDEAVDHLEGRRLAASEGPMSTAILPAGI